MDVSSRWMYSIGRPLRSQVDSRMRFGELRQRLLFANGPERQPAFVAAGDPIIFVDERRRVEGTRRTGGEDQLRFFHDLPDATGGVRSADSQRAFFHEAIHAHNGLLVAVKRLHV